MKKLLSIFLLKKVFVFLLLIAFLNQQRVVFAQALPIAPAANFVMNRAIGGVLTRVAIARGFAANDPRILATLAGTSGAITGVNVASTVAGVGLAIAGAPVWLTVAAGLGVFAIGSIIAGHSAFLKLTDGALIVDASKSVATRTDNPSGLQPPEIPWAGQLERGINIYRLPDCFPTQSCYAYKPLPDGPNPFLQNFQSSDTRAGSVAFVFTSLNELINKYLPRPKTIQGPDYVVIDTYAWVVQPHFEDSANGIYRLVGSVAFERKCVSGLCTVDDGHGGIINFASITFSPMIRDWDSVNERIVIDPIAHPNKYKDLDSAIQAMPDSAKDEVLSPEFLASVADQAWMKAASQPGYQGLPYSVTQPVTVTDVQSWAAENPASQPKIGDLFTPANNPGNNTVPISVSIEAAPSQNTNPGAIQNVNVVNAPKVDLGEDPKIAPPSIDAPPAVVESIAPLIFLFPELKNYQTPQHAAECPKPQFNVFGKTFVMDSHCNLLENNRFLIASTMTVVWTIVGIFILLSA